MSVGSMIAAHGKSVTIVRKTYGSKDASGFPVTSATASTATTMLLQVGGGGTSRFGGGERNQYDATGYVTGDVSVLDGDFVTYADGVGTRTYRVESVRIPDERPSGDVMQYQIVGLQEDRPRT